MALICDYSFKGIIVPNAYFRISWAPVFKVYEEDEQPIVGGKLKLRMDIEVSAGQGQTCFNVLNREKDYDPSIPNPLEQGYAYLKTLPEFAGAVDG